MTVTLAKGQNISLSKSDPSLTRIVIGLGWDARSTDGQDFDLDASAFLLDGTGKVRGDADFIFYNQLRSQDGSVEHTGDNRTGDAEGDDEQIKVNLTSVPAGVERIAIAVTIHDFVARQQNFGMVRNAFIRVVNSDTDAEIVRFDLSEDYSTEAALIFGEVYRNGGEWKFRAVGQGYAGGLGAMAKHFGVSVA